MVGNPHTTSQNVFVFAPNGTVVMSMLNCLGAMQDSEVPSIGVQSIKCMSSMEQRPSWTLLLVRLEKRQSSSQQ